MIVMNVMLDNLYSFNDFSINFSYPKKIVNSSIENEFLSYAPSFRFKKFILLMGPNASGKTTLGKAIKAIFNFLMFKEYANIVDIINDKKKPASFVIDIVTDNHFLLRAETKIHSLDDSIDYEDINVSVRKEPIRKNDTYAKCLNRLLAKKYERDDNYIKELEKIDRLSWMFKFSGVTNDNPVIGSEDNEKRFLDILNFVLKSLDHSIKRVTKIASTKNKYLVAIGNRKEIIENGSISSNNTLSSGTREGIDISYMLAGLINKDYSFYYCDEKLTHVHSDVESALVSLFIECLNSDYQMIMTSHNYELLDMHLPFHSYAFIKKDINGKISCRFASDYLERNTDSLKNAIENDYFDFSPNVEDIYSIKENV